MAFTRERKSQDLEKLKTALGSAESVVFINFHGLKVGEITDIRKDLRGKGVSYLVAKKTLINRVLKEMNDAGEVPTLPGEVAILYGNDPIAPAREIYQFQRKFKDNLAILGGIFEKKFQTKEEAVALATIPPLQTLYGQFVGLLTSPMRGLVISLSEIAKQKTS